MASSQEADDVSSGAWNNETVMRFLNFYMAEPAIWDPGHTLHKNRNEIYDAWKRIQDKFNKDIPIVELKKKKDSLMATFRNCVQKVKKSEHSGAGTNEIYTPQWFAYSFMAKFLLYHDAPRTTINSEDLQTLTAITEQNALSVDSQQNSENIDSQQITTPGPSTKHPNTFTPKKTPIRIPGKKRKISEEGILDKMEKAYNILTENPQQQENDECMIFGQLIGRRLQQMEQSERDYVMHQMENIMYESKLRQGSLNNSQHWGIYSSSAQNLGHSVASTSASSVSQDSNQSQYTQSEYTTTAKSLYESF